MAGVNLVFIPVAFFLLAVPISATEGEMFGEEFFARCRTAFTQVDTDQDGKIRYDQLMEVLKAAQPDVTEEGVDGLDMIAAMADVDDDNMLTADEFINFMKAGAAGEDFEPSREQLGKAMFKLHDTDKNGKLSLDELNAMYLVQSGGRPEMGVTGMMDYALAVMDTDGDGQLSLEEYINPTNGGFSLDGF